MITFIDDNKDVYTVESICSELPIAVSTYYAAKSRPPSKRQIEDETLLPEVVRVHAENCGVYGRRKIHAQMNREGFEIGRDRCERLMKQVGIAGAVRGKKPRTTVANEKAERAPDLVDRKWEAEARHRLVPIKVWWSRTHPVLPRGLGKLDVHRS